MEKKKILIVSYYWPPSGGPGVQRWLKFAKYLPEFGFEPIIYTPENPSYPLEDKSLEKEIPKGITIVKTRIWEPYALAEKFSSKNKKFKGGQFDVGKNQSLLSKLSIWVRGNFFIPDARVFWVKPSIKFLSSYLKEHNIDLLVTTGPPHSMHLIGLGLKKKLPQLQWIADFRDPWTEISYHKHLKLSKASEKKHLDLESQVFRTADLTIATSYLDTQMFSQKGARALTITNGFDKDLREIEKQGEKSPSDRFTLTYAGVLEQLRNPSLLWEVLSELSKEDQEFKKDLLIRVAGRMDEKIVEEIQNLGLSSSLELLGYLSHEKAVEEMNRADLLVLTNFPKEESRGIIPGKLFEYLAAAAQILSFGPSDSDVEKILEETEKGKHFTFTERKELKEFLLKSYTEFKSAQKNNAISIEKIKPFSRRALTESLAKELNKLS